MIHHWMTMIHHHAGLLIDSQVLKQCPQRASIHRLKKGQIIIVFVFVLAWSRKWLRQGHVHISGLGVLKVGA